jgi:hypothetical protein
MQKKIPLVNSLNEKNTKLALVVAKDRAQAFKTWHFIISFYQLDGGSRKMIKVPSPFADSWSFFRFFDSENTAQLSRLFGLRISWMHSFGVATPGIVNDGL